MQHTGIHPRVIAEIAALAKRYDLHKVILFGSRARGDHHRTSDIDLAVSGGDIARFALETEETTSTLLSFDIINLDEPVQQELLCAIQREGIMLYEKI